ncbi:hypothetical protein EYF80_064755 [Liparis tanakae]|uniref:Uncharacterized protein n=1 Tax=Liparis tanakae TaxID=230148 RepID=A0A4Z2E8I7_9TELE|nr:hypothetical protein EYF80_064755 [Liparis tanakae]
MDRKKKSIRSIRREEEESGRKRSQGGGGITSETPHAGTVLPRCEEQKGQGLGLGSAVQILWLI